MPHVPLITKLCATIVILIGLWIMIDVRGGRKNDDEPYRRRWILLALVCLLWGALVWLPLLPVIADEALLRNAIHALRLVCLFGGIGVLISLYKAGQVGLKKGELKSDTEQTE